MTNFLLADSHCHILDPRLNSRAEEIASRLNDDGLEFIVEISASPQESKEALAFAEKHDNVYCTIGVHPIMAHKVTQEFEHWALAQKSKKIIAVGECGLDYYDHGKLPGSPHDGSTPRDVQKEIFIRHIMIADKLKLPLVIHMRDAFKDMLVVLTENKKFIRNGILFHCFSEGASEVERIREHFDSYFAFGGAVTYTNKKMRGKSDEAIRAVPLDRLLIETDAPYLSPEPLRGKINEPKNVRIVAEYVARVLGLPFEAVAAATLENTKRFFRLT